MIVPVQRRARQHRSCCNCERNARLWFGCVRLLVVRSGSRWLSRGWRPAGNCVWKGTVRAFLPPRSFLLSWAPSLSLRCRRRHWNVRLLCWTFGLWVAPLRVALSRWCVGEQQTVGLQAFKVSGVPAAAAASAAICNLIQWLSNDVRELHVKQLLLLKLSVCAVLLQL